MKALKAALLTLVLCSAAHAAGPPAFWNEDLTGLQAMAGTKTGALATATPQEKGNRSTVRFRVPPETSDRFVSIKGQVRSLLFIDEGATLLAVVQKRSRRTAWDTYLLKMDTATARTNRLVTLPRSAAGMAVWPGARHLLVACDQEIRSFTLPGFRSGPLYVLPGGNLALAHHSGPLFLVSRTGDLVLVNLEDSQAEDRLPVRQRFGASNPLRYMSITPDRTELYGVTPTGEKVQQPLDVLDLAAAVSPRMPRKPPAAEPEPEALPEPEPIPEPEPQTAPQPEPEVTEPPEPGPEVVQQPAPKPVQDMKEPRFQLSGSLSGAVAHRVEWVVILGPNNILREATRVRPGADGAWGVDALAPGRYRIVLDAGGGHALVSSPRFLTVEVAEGETVQAPPFDVQRVR